LALRRRDLRLHYVWVEMDMKGYFSKDEWWTYFDWTADESSTRDVPDEFIARFEAAKKEMVEVLEIIFEKYVTE
jgi:hypothetical protein